MADIIAALSDPVHAALATWAGLGVGLFGFGFALWQLQRTRTAAVEAKEAAQAAGARLSERSRLVVFPLISESFAQSEGYFGDGRYEESRMAILRALNMISIGKAIATHDDVARLDAVLDWAQILRQGIERFRSDRATAAERDVMADAFDDALRASHALSQREPEVQQK